jgi:ATP-dependent DNA helicase DinG
MLKDLPLLEEFLGRPFRFGTLKGRGNYLCLRRCAELETGGFLAFGDAGATSEKIVRWSRKTETGELSELELPETHPVLERIAATRDGCLGKLCPLKSECFLQRLYLQAQGWHLIVTNYHLFFSHLDGGKRPFPLRFDALLCDEAHRIPEAARSSATRAASPERFRKILSTRHLSNFMKAFRCLKLPDGNLESAWLKAAQGVERIFSRLALLSREESVFTRPLADLRHDLEGSVESLAGEAGRLVARIMEDEEFPEAAEGFAVASQLIEALEDLRWCLDVVDYPRWATWWDGSQIQSAPVLGSVPVRDALDCLGDVPIICTSATLKVGGDFRFWERESGISPAGTLSLDSPFDLPSQMTIWVIDLGLRVTDQGYDAAASRVIEKLCVENGGRSLVLCSSIRLLKAVSVRMKAEKREFRLLCQGDAPKEELLEDFRSDETSVLIGSLSFREGIDIPGEGLTQVILDRIPFPHPEDPLVKARRELEGKDTFLRTTLPMSRLFLRQAFGRLIRRKTDAGRVVILDGRALQREDWGIFQDFPGVPVRRVRLRQTP